MYNLLTKGTHIIILIILVYYHCYSYFIADGTLAVGTVFSMFML